MVSTLVLVLLHGLWAQAERLQRIALVPQPLKLERGSGEFQVTRGMAILVDRDSAAAAEIGRQLAERTNRGTGLALIVTPAADPAAVRHAIRLTTQQADASLGAEGYTLEVSPQGVVISATAGPGLFYGTQTLLQLMPPAVFRAAHGEPAASWTMPAVRIEDRPRFRWRMLLLDVARHFFSKAEVKNFIDLMAEHKLNTLQLHLTDHEGWRLEIKRFPRLTQVGGWRNGIGFGLDPKLGTAYGPDGRYGGFYTQSDMRELIAYAKARYVTLVPEIEMPGHNGAAVSVYPQYSCAGSGGPYCIGNEGTFAFLEGVLSEVIDVFPSKYIHVGGDEVDKTNWKKCPKCQTRLRQEGLKDENQLQSYFIRRIEEFLNSRHRTLVGWDEILEGGVAPNAVVMSWRGIEGGIAAARAGHDVVMTPVSHCYFDYYQAKTGEPKAIGGFLPLETVYAFEPVPAALDADQAKHVLGGGGNLWTEFVPNYAHVQYMVYPRACAMAETLWTAPGQKNWDDFNGRLGTHLERLCAQAVHYRESRPADSPPGK
jgi:hexosaminidase